jgi:hypothetical protein
VDNVREDQTGDYENRTATALAIARKAAAEFWNAEGLGNYTPESISSDEIPLTTDLVAFVIWLRKNSDFFSGPNLDIHFPQADSPEFTDVLGQLAVIYTGCG